MAEVRVIKKYTNRRLYDTAESRYIALDDIRQLVADGVPFRVIDAGGGEDITRSILLQIIVEQEDKGQPILSTRLLEQIILYYGNTLQAFVGTYLEKSMDSFVSQQQVLQDQMEHMLKMAPSSVLKDMAERNLELWKTMQEDLLKAYVPGTGTGKPGRKKGD
jgi:polyhydroxyalkanoate synthesis repressor PhaR